MIAFSDNDLGKIKRHIKECKSETNIGIFNLTELLRLLARLEAAERAYLYHLNPIDCPCEICDAWRRAAGNHDL